MSGFGNTPKDTTNIPLGSVAVPGTSNGDLTALQGGPASTDSNSNSSAPVSTYVYSGNFVDFGQTTSSTATTDTGTFTFMAFVKRMLQKLTSLVTNTSAFVDAATTGATLQTVNDTTVLANVGAQGTWQIEIIPNSAFVGTIIFEGLSLDATTWGTMTGHLAGSSSMASSSTFTGTGNVTQIWRGNSSTYKQVRARLSAVSASNAVVYVGLSAAPYAISITNQIQTNLDQVNGTALSSGNPVPTLDTNSAAILSDLVLLLTNTTGLATQATLASVLADIVTLLTSTGAITDAAWAGGSNAGSEIAILKQIGTVLNNLIVQSIGYGWNGGTTAGNYDRLASIEAFGTVASAVVSSINTSLNQLAISSGSLATLKPGAEIWADNGSGGNLEKLIVTNAWNGSTPVTVTSTPVNTGNTRIRWNAPAVGGSGQNLVLGMNMPAFMQYVYDNAGGGPRLLQGDGSGFLRANTSNKAGYIALSSPPANTNAGSDTTLTFAQLVNRFLVQNLTAATIYVELDTAAGLTSIALLPGAIWTDPIQVTAIHLYTVAAQPINAANGIIVKGWA